MSDSLRPPRLLMGFLETLLPRDWQESGEGDFAEEYADRAAAKGRTAAGAWLALQIARCIPQLILHYSYWAVVMLRNYVIISLRDIRNNSFYAMIKIFGLGVGIACSLLVFLFVRDELSYDRFHSQADRIFRVAEKVKTPTGENTIPYTKAGIGTKLREDYPEVRNAVQFVRRQEFIAVDLDTRVDATSVYADPSFFEIFSFPLLRGDRATALRDPNSALLTESLAKKLVGDDDPIGKTVSAYHGNEKYDLRVAGVLKDVPANSHFRFDFVGSLDHIWRRAGEDSHGIVHTYIQLARGALSRELEAKLPNFVRGRYGEELAARLSLHIQPITSIHLHSRLSLEMGKNSSLSVSSSLGLFGLTILLVASINFINLSTARAGRRSREVGLRKTVGATKPQLVLQFLIESLVLSLISLGIAVFMAALTLPFFNPLVGKSLHLDIVGQPQILLGSFILAFVVALLSGLYPSFVIASYEPAEAFKGGIKKKSAAGSFVRRGLVILQFAASLVFIMGALTIVRQLDYVGKKDLGFRHENVISINILRDFELSARRDLLEREIRGVPGVEDAILTNGTPGINSGYPIKCISEGASEDSPTELNMVFFGFGYFRFFGIDVLQGRDIDRDIPTDAWSSILINESARRSLGWEDPVGKWLKNDFFVDEQNRPVAAKVIGVVPDFHNGSLHDPIKPSVYKIIPDSDHLIYVRLRPDSLQETLRALAAKWRTLPTRLPFAYKFVDEQMTERSYQKDIRSARVYGIASILAVVLACLGAVGQMSFAAERRKKEIGIRKVLGASTKSIFAMLTKESVGLALAANLLAWPAAYYLMNHWLAGFAYRRAIAWGLFAASTAAIMAIGVLTVSIQGLRAAGANPAPIIRNE